MVLLFTSVRHSYTKLHEIQTTLRRYLAQTLPEGQADFPQLEGIIQRHLSADSLGWDQEKHHTQKNGHRGGLLNGARLLDSTIDSKIAFSLFNWCFIKTFWNVSFEYLFCSEWQTAGVFIIHPQDGSKALCCVDTQEERSKKKKTRWRVDLFFDWLSVCHHQPIREEEEGAENVLDYLIWCFIRRR